MKREIGYYWVNRQGWLWAVYFWNGFTWKAFWDSFSDDELQQIDERVIINPNVN